MPMLPTNAFSASTQPAQATASMPMNQMDAARASTGYASNIPRSLPGQASQAAANTMAQRPTAQPRPVLPAQANQRAVAAVNKQAPQRMAPSAPVSPPAVPAQQSMPAQMTPIGQGLIGRPMTSRVPQ